ncbi:MULTISPECIES: hypothetical protein [Paenibacillus]|uniref:hypothetical protein n=1 Tax=Paenibacillus TaxID=44249 RepID=UPI0011A3334A|nr:MULTISPECIES: hypothetical protein [Paenibacillus]MCM3494057.1 hypothetical protein [Paenibacillus lactis]
MNPISKKVMVSSMAAALVLGGAGYLQSKVFAAASTDAAASATEAGQAGTNAGTDTDAVKSSDGKRLGIRGGGPFGGHLMTEASEVLGMTESDIRSALEAGSTLAEIAENNGMSKSDFVQKLVALESAKLDERLSEDGISDTKAAELKEGLNERLTEAVDGSAQELLMKGHGKGGRGFGKFGKPEEIAALLGMTEDELKAGLEGGQSLAELADAKGMTEEELLQKLKEQLTEPLKQWIHEKSTDSNPSDASKTDTEAESAAE